MSWKQRTESEAYTSRSRPAFLKEAHAPAKAHQPKAELRATPFAADDYKDDGFNPQGAFIFVMLMLAGYAIYWFYIWYIVVIERA